MSAKKDSLVNIGGWLALNDQEKFEDARNLVVVYEGLHTYGGLAGRDMEAMARGIEESVDDVHIRARVGQVEYLGNKLMDWGVPDRSFRSAATPFSWMPDDSIPISPGLFPGPDPWLRRSIIEAGVRTMERGILSAGRDPETGKHRYPKLELVRVTIPRRVYTQAHMDVTAEAIEEVCGTAARQRGSIGL